MKRATLGNFSQGNYVFMFQDGIDKLQEMPGCIFAIKFKQKIKEEGENFLKNGAKRLKNALLKNYRNVHYTYPQKNISRNLVNHKKWV